MKEYTKYRWFYTSKGTLVVGGKSAEQNDELLRDVLKLGKEYYVLHTSHPGSPFSVIMQTKEKVTPGELEEVAVFTACFSRAWKEKKKTTSIDVFTTTQLSKESGMKEGMWRVKGTVKKMTVSLELALTKQKGVLRAVPTQSTKKAILTMKPGRIDKVTMALKLQVELDNDFGQEELLGALPAGGIDIIR